MKRVAYPFMIVLYLVGVLTAEVKIAGVFSDGMVLQRQMPVPVWGWSEPGQKVTVSFAGQEHEAVADNDGKWKVTLAPMEASFENRELKAGDVVVKNVLVGEVWFCTGQSNMEWPLNRTGDSNVEWKYPHIRVMTTPKKASFSPVLDLELKWEACDAPRLSFSSVGFHFGTRLQKEIEVPIGLIDSSWGGTRVEPWIAPEGFQLARDLHPVMKTLAEDVAALDPASKAYHTKINSFIEAHAKSFEQWEAAAKSALEKGEYAPNFPNLPNFQPSNHHQQPSRIYFSRVLPLVPFAMRGVIWYQGESNGKEGVTYLRKKQALIEGWRKVWGQPLSFYYVQLADFRPVSANPGLGDGWARLREAQLNTMSEVKDTGMAVICDIGHPGDIHPKNKYDVGNRLALWALAKNYGKTDLVYSGPLYKGSRIDGEKMIIDFDYVGGGLVVGRKEGRKPTQILEGKEVNGFAIAGEDKVFHLADAVIEGKQVKVSSDKVSKPVAVRFGFCQNPRGMNLYNREGLLASPFRTDSWD